MMIFNPKYFPRSLITVFITSFMASSPLLVQAQIPYALNVSNANGNFNYSTIELGAAGIDIDNVEDTATAYYAEGRLEINEMAFVLGKMSKANYRIANIETEHLLYEIGVGSHSSIDASTDLFGYVSLVQVNIENNASDTDDTGYKLGLGLRHHLNQNFDIETQVDYTNLFDEGEFSGSISGLMKVGNQFQVGGTLDTENDSTEVRAFARLGFL